MKQRDKVKAQQAYRDALNDPAVQAARKAVAKTKGVDTRGLKGKTAQDAQRERTQTKADALAAKAAAANEAKRRAEQDFELKKMDVRRKEAVVGDTSNKYTADYQRFRQAGVGARTKQVEKVNGPDHGVLYSSFKTRAVGKKGTLPAAATRRGAAPRTGAARGAGAGRAAARKTRNTERAPRIAADANPPPDATPPAATPAAGGAKGSAITPSARVLSTLGG